MLEWNMRRRTRTLLMKIEAMVAAPDAGIYFRGWPVDTSPLPSPGTPPPAWLGRPALWQRVLPGPGPAAVRSGGPRHVPRGLPQVQRRLAPAVGTVV